MLLRLMQVITLTRWTGSLSKQLQNIMISNPGIYGLNLEASQSLLGPEWCIRADNLVFDITGRLASRKGSKRVNASTATEDIVQIFEYIDASGTTLDIVCTDTKIYKISGTSLTDITGTAVPTKGNWKFQNFNGKCVGFQKHHDPVVLSSITGSFAKISLSGTNQPSVNANEVLASFGRIFVIDGTSVLASDSLDETGWNTVAVDLTSNWLYGMDVGVGLAEFNGNLVIFGKDSITIFQNPWDLASTFSQVENIGGIGCVARDTVQQVGGDLWFLSASGIRSLGRTIQEKSMPLRELSKNVRRHLISEVNNEDLDRVRSTYSHEEGFYLLSLPITGEVYCFDTRGFLQDSSARVTKWNVTYHALCTTQLQKLYFGAVGYVAYYYEYLDNYLYDGTGGSTYSVVWHSGWTDFGSDLIKIPKKLHTDILGASGQTITTIWAYDFDDLATAESYSSTVPTVTTSVYGTAVYGTDVYGTDNAYYKAKVPLTKTGQVMRYGIETTVNSNLFAIQRSNILVKTGRAA